MKKRRLDVVDRLDHAKLLNDELHRFLNVELHRVHARLLNVELHRHRRREHGHHRVEVDSLKNDDHPHAEVLVASHPLDVERRADAKLLPHPLAKAVKRVANEMTVRMTVRRRIEVAVDVAHAHRRDLHQHDVEARDAQRGGKVVGAVLRGGRAVDVMPPETEVTGDGAHAVRGPNLGHIVTTIKRRKQRKRGS